MFYLYERFRCSNRIPPKRAHPALQNLNVFFLSPYWLSWIWIREAITMLISRISIGTYTGIAKIYIWHHAFWILGNCSGFLLLKYQDELAIGLGHWKPSHYEFFWIFDTVQESQWSFIGHYEHFEAKNLFWILFITVPTGASISWIIGYAFIMYFDFTNLVRIRAKKPRAVFFWPGSLDAH